MGKGRKSSYNIETHSITCLTMVIQELFFKAESFQRKFFEDYFAILVWGYGSCSF